MKRRVSNLIVIGSQLLIVGLFFVTVFSNDVKVVKYASIVHNDNLNKIATSVSILFEEEDVKELEYLDDLVLEDLPSIEVIKEEMINVSEEEYIEIVNQSLSQKFTYFDNTNIDTLICGCTHFGYLIDEYKKHLNVENYITSENAMLDFLKDKISFVNHEKPSRMIYTSSDSIEFQRKLSKMNIFENVNKIEVKH